MARRKLTFIRHEKGSVEKSRQRRSCYFSVLTYVRVHSARKNGYGLSCERPQDRTGRTLRNPQSRTFLTDPKPLTFKMFLDVFVLGELYYSTFPERLFFSGSVLHVNQTRNFTWAWGDAWRDYQQLASSSIGVLEELYPYLLILVADALRRESLENVGQRA